MTCMWIMPLFVTSPTRAAFACLVFAGKDFGLRMRELTDEGRVEVFVWN